MLRRSHKKSRGGCLPCKQRHVKCDEGRPGCLLCAMSDRECTYAMPQTSPQPVVSNRRALESEINIDDMELLVHLTVAGDEIFSLRLGDKAFTNPATMSLALKLGLKFLYPLS
ncbi:hypothetical protein ASPZODRAFT_20556 [Penicilliopsis zonata CBS 506.65]|uniref:Zn(2)-C6 fungal-type domain-containing protein n=1 Tax=Penicilliopsis zonata CBS 506.65 TaxID=1073090 RepID=A0A1L9S585_9EURO|nr:hypothetical protein ASPZODRAFT_20556 [Penicilliopsis zonata CBS 506.65]OJJ42329.1 hypothetical protein ASPZODRAFT_20556 [Penicilliopsis zonata CBS 506.65]